MITCGGMLGLIYRDAIFNPKYNTFMFDDNRIGYIPKKCNCEPCGFEKITKLEQSLLNGNNRLLCKCKKCNKDSISKEKSYLQFLREARRLPSDVPGKNNHLLALKSTIPGIVERPKCSNCHGVKDRDFHVF